MKAADPGACCSLVGGRADMDTRDDYASPVVSQLTQSRRPPRLGGGSGTNPSSDHSEDQTRVPPSPIPWWGRCGPVTYSIHLVALTPFGRWSIVCVSTMPQPIPPPISL